MIAVALPAIEGLWRDTEGAKVSLALQPCEQMQPLQRPFISYQVSPIYLNEIKLSIESTGRFAVPWTAGKPVLTLNIVVGGVCAAM